MPSYRSFPRIAAVLAIGALFLAGSRAQAAPVPQPEGWDSDLRLREAVDHNPDPGIVEVHLDARVARVEVAPGVAVDAWTYDGGVPGPLIRARVGDRVVVRF